MNLLTTAPAPNRPRLGLAGFGWLALAILMTAARSGAADEPPHIYHASDLVDGEVLQSWLVCGPFPNADAMAMPLGEWIHGDACTGLYTDYLAPVGGERSAVPLPGDKVAGPDGENRTWTAVSSRNDRIYLGDFMAPTENQIGYAVSWIDADVPVDRLVGLGSSDGIRVWVNGVEVFRVHRGRDLVLDDNYFRLPLVEGRNQLLLKLENGEGPWGFALRPADNGEAIKALSPRLKEVLAFDYTKSETGYTVTWGDPTIVGNLEGLPEAQIALLTGAGEQAGEVAVPLGQPFFIPFDQYTEGEYTLAGEVLWPYRGRVKAQGLLYRGDLRAELMAMLDAGQPMIPPSRAAAAYEHLLGTVENADRLNRFGGAPRAYYRLKTGMTHALDTAVTLQNSQSPYDRLFPRPRNVGTSGHESVTLTESWILSTAASIFDDSLESHIHDRWSAYTEHATGEATGRVYVLALETDLLATPIPELRGDDSEFKEPAESIRDRVPDNPEGYAIRIEPNRIVVAGRQAAGAWYGLDTLLQLLAQGTTLRVGTIIDAPQYPLRAAELPLESFDDDFRRTIDELAALRFNTVFLPSSLYPDLEDTEIGPLVTEAYAYCRARFVDPIPLVETFGGNTLAAAIDPNFIEGIHVQELPVAVDDLRRLHLPYDRILVNESTVPQVRTGKGYKILREGRDFEFESLAPPVIQLLGQAPVQTGETLLISADVVDHSIASTGASCPSDTAAWLLTEKVLGSIYETLSPTGIHLGQRGAGYLNRDSRCLAREMPNALLLADAFQKGYDIVRNLDKNAQLYLWGDHFSPFQRAGELDAMKAAEYLPKDVIVLDGWYRGATDYDAWRVTQGIRFFDQLGLKTLGAVRDEPLNIQQMAAMNLDFPRRFRGIVHEPGADYGDGRYLAAEANWTGTTALGILSDD